jgi:hypothetical protein
MKCFFPLVLLGLGLSLAACQSGRANHAATALPTPALACRSEASLATLHGAGDGFQRAADAELASGRCRRFSAGASVVDLTASSFTDPANGQSYLIFR